MKTNTIVPSQRTKNLFVISSSYGHLFPAIKIAQTMQDAGQDVLFAAAKEYEQLLIMYGFKCIGVTNSPTPFLATVDWYGEEVVADQVRVLDQIIGEYQPNRIVTTPLVISSFILAERHNIYTMVIGYTEYLFPGVDEDKLSPKQWRIESLTGYYNNARGQLGLPPVDPDPVDTPLLGDLYLHRSTPEFDGYQTLPDKVRYVGGLYWEPIYENRPLATKLKEAKLSNLPIWYVQIGRLFDDIAKWHGLVEVMKRTPAHFIVDIARGDYLRDDYDLPDNVTVERFVPIGFLEKHLDGIICSGQTTSVLAAIKYRKPILSFPFTDDSKELTNRAVENNIGLGIFNNSNINYETISDCMNKLLYGSCAKDLDYWSQQFSEFEQNFQNTFCNANEAAVA